MAQRLCAPSHQWAVEQFEDIGFGDRRLSKESLP
jgi:hypothetical protein